MGEGGIGLGGGGRGGGGRERRERVHVYRMREVDRMRGVQNEGGGGGIYGPTVRFIRQSRAPCFR